MMYSVIYTSTKTGKTITSRHWFVSKEECIEAIERANIKEYKIREVSKKFAY